MASNKHSLEHARHFLKHTARKVILANEAVEAFTDAEVHGYHDREQALGISLMDPECILESVVPFSSGAHVLRPGDRIVSVNGVEVSNFDEFVSACYPDDADTTDSGGTVILQVHRANLVRGHISFLLSHFAELVPENTHTHTHTHNTHVAGI